MLRNYLQTALRFLNQNKLFAGINLIGLSISLAVSFIILLYVINELSYDRIHKNRESVYRIKNFYADTKSINYSVPYILTSALKENFPQIEKAISVMNVPLTFKTDKSSFNENAISTDSEVFDIFTLPLIDGQLSTNLLSDKYSIVISRELAGKLFGSQNPVGRQVLANIIDGDHLFTVESVFENIPENSTFRAQCFINSKWSTESINKKFGIKNAETSWMYDLWTTWVLISKKNDIKLLNAQLGTFGNTNIKGRPESVYSLQNLSDVYLGSDDKGGSVIRGNTTSLRIFSAIAFLIIVVAAINYVILSTAISTGRTKEIGIRKAFGASINKIKIQFLSESILLVGLSLPFAVVLMWLVLPVAERLFQTQLQIIRSNIVVYILSYFTLLLSIGFVSGFYVSNYLSKLNVLKIFVSAAHSGRKKNFFRSSLIVLQLVIFCSFMTSALIIRSQYKYALNKDLGYYNKNILLVDLGRDFNNYMSYLNIIKSIPNVIMAAGTNVSLPMVEHTYISTKVSNFENKEIQVMIAVLFIDFNFFETMGMTIIEGRDFSKDFGGDVGNSIILNETAVKDLGLTDPIGKIIYGNNIVGIVKDFNIFSLHSGIIPLYIALTNKNMKQIAIRYKTGELASILTMLQSEWKKIAPDRPFQYTNIEDVIENLYSSEKNLVAIVSITALFTLIIASFGLFGLTLFIARSRIKETGIKKAFGSSERALVFSFLRENFILVTIAALVSVPITSHFMLQWLSRFAYKTNIVWWLFILAYLCATTVVLLTVFYHSYEASSINPIKALRYE